MQITQSSWRGHKMYQQIPVKRFGKQTTQQWWWWYHWWWWWWWWFIFNLSRLECLADGNPAPTYRYFHHHYDHHHYHNHYSHQILIHHHHHLPSHWNSKYRWFKNGDTATVRFLYNFTLRITIMMMRRRRTVIRTLWSRSYGKYRPLFKVSKLVDGFSYVKQKHYDGPKNWKLGGSLGSPITSTAGN